MNFFGRLFGSDNVINKAADGIYNGVDKAFFTDEEKAAHFLNLLKAYEPFKLAQRMLMLIITIPFVFVWLICVALYVASLFVDPQCVVYPDIATECVNRLDEGSRTLAKMNVDTLGQPAFIVLAFYFGGGAVEGVVSRVVDRKKSRDK